MAVYRKINVNFWEDEKIIDEFTPEDKFFMLYLMTNPHTNQIGCYQISTRQMEFETGYLKETILKLIKRFEDVHRIIKYSEDTKEILILNWHKYNWSNSPKIFACMMKEYENIKSKGLKSIIDTLLIQYGYSIDNVSIPKHNNNKNNNKNNKKEEEKEKQKDIFCNQDFEKCFNIYSETCTNLIPLNFERRSKALLEELLNFLTEIDYDFSYFSELCKKANSLEKIVDSKIDFKSMIKNHIGITNGKYNKAPTTALDKKYSAIDDFFAKKREVTNG